MEKKKQSMVVWKPDLRPVTLQTIKEELNDSINAARTTDCLYIK